MKNKRFGIGMAIFIALLFTFTHTIFGQEIVHDINYQQNLSRGGIGIGSIIAIVASWSRSKSVLWAIFHAFCGWLYVIYFVVTR